MRPTTPSRYAGTPAKRLTFLIGVRDRYRHNSLEVELVKRARKFKLAGATVFEGIEGFGASGHLHRVHVVSDDRPLAVVFVDVSDKIDAFLESVTPLLHDVAVVVDEIEIVSLRQTPASGG